MSMKRRSNYSDDLGLPKETSKPNFGNPGVEAQGIIIVANNSIGRFANIW
jgi:hypothetical protein